MSKELYAILAIAIMSVITMILRFAPIVLFSGKQVPKWIDYLGKVLPFAMMPILVMYCVEDTDWTYVGSLVPMLLGVTATGLVHYIKKNTILSLCVGLTVYMVLLRVVAWPI